MNLLELFADPRQLELAFALAALPQDSPERAQRLADAGVPAPQRAEFLKTLQAFEQLRQSAGCGPCTQVDRCLDENTLAEFVDGVLPESEMPRVERQLAHCGGCLSKAVALVQLTQELTPAPRWPEVVIGIARRGMQILSAPFEGFAEQALQPIAVLSDNNQEPVARRWQVADHGVTATFTMVVEESGTASLRVNFARAGQAVTEGQVGLRLDDALVESRPLKGAEEEVFHHIEPGHYVLEFTPDSAATAAYGIVLEDSSAS